MYQSISSLIWYIVGFFLLAIILWYFWAKVSTLLTRLMNGHQAYNNVVIGTCALVTLLWGCYTFDALQQRSRAVAELAEIQKRIKDTEATFLDIKVTQTKASKGFYLNPTVSIKNSSSEAIYFKLCKDSLSVSQLAFSPEGRAKSVKRFTPALYEKISNDSKIPNTTFHDIRVPVSSERNLNFFLPVQEAGVYYITFSALSSNDANGAQSKDSNGTEPKNANGDKSEVACSFDTGEGIPKDKKINGKDSIWFASTYLIVK